MSVKKYSRFSLFVVLVLAIGFASQAALASTIIVGTCQSGIQFTSITAAINAAPAGSIIKICPGNYLEQPPAITKKLTLEGIASGNDNAVVVYPPAAGLTSNTSDARGTVAAQILVQNTAGPVVISNITVDGTGNNDTSDDLRGILYQDASGTVKDVMVQNELPAGSISGDQSGQGIMVETTNSNSASLAVTSCSVHNYNKNGIVARYAGASLAATGNYVQGNGIVPNSAAQNGIELAFSGPTGTIKNNTVIDNVYVDTSIATSSDILLYDSGANVTVSGNVLGNSQEAISLTAATAGFGDGASVTGNKIFGNAYGDAIDVCTNHNVVTGNTIFNTTQSGVHLDSSCTGGTGNNNTVSTNTMVGSACAGYLVDSGTSGNGNTTGTFFTVPFEIATSTASCTLPEVKAGKKLGAKPRP
jgi:parallel beta-helix repeat protein